MSALDPEGCFHTWPDGPHASHSCLEDLGHDGAHVCSCGAIADRTSRSEEEGTR